MSSFSVFMVNTTDLSLQDILDIIHGLGHKTQRTKRVDHSEEDKEVGYRILETDITFSDPQEWAFLASKPILVRFFLPYPATGLQQYPAAMNKALFQKLKRRLKGFSTIPLNFYNEK